MQASRVRSFLAGVLVANSAPHLATAAARRRHLTPLAGRASGPAVNGLWALLNLAGAGLLLGCPRQSAVMKWDRDLYAFEGGYLAFALWMSTSELLFKINAR